jgi:hypothetical protein
MRVSALLLLADSVVAWKTFEKTNAVSGYIRDHIPVITVPNCPSAAACQQHADEHPNATIYTWHDETVKPPDNLLCVLRLDSTWHTSQQTHHTSGCKDSACPPPTPPPAPTPLINDKVYHHIASQFGRGFAMFQHFSVNTFALNPTTPVGNSSKCIEHNCGNGSSCADPKLFNPTDLNTTQWVNTAKAMGADEICLTAHHEGGFALWPSKFSSYSIAASPWKGGKGDILSEFGAAARAAGIKICYYIGPNANGFLLQEGYNVAEFNRRNLGMFREVLTTPAYGPVHRLWIDHPWQVRPSTPMRLAPLCTHAASLLSVLIAHTFWLLQPCHDPAAGPMGKHGRLPEWTLCPPGGWSNGTNRSTFPWAQLQYDDLVTQLSPDTIMGGR